MSHPLQRAIRKKSNAKMVAPIAFLTSQSRFAIRYCQYEAVCHPYGTASAIDSCQRTTWTVADPIGRNMPVLEAGMRPVEALVDLIFFHKLQEGCPRGCDHCRGLRAVHTCLCNVSMPKCQPQNRPLILHVVVRMKGAALDLASNHGVEAVNLGTVPAKDSRKGGHAERFQPQCVIQRHVIEIADCSLHRVARPSRMVWHSDDLFPDVNKACLV